MANSGMNKRLKSIREANGFTQEQFAELLEMSSSGYKKVEKGDVNLSVNKIKILKSKLGISADFILFGEKADTKSVWDDIFLLNDNDKWKTLFRLYAHLSKNLKSHEESEKVLDYIDKIVDVMDGEQI